MVDLLFVYGTLLQHTASAMAKFLQGEAIILGTAYLPGRLYDLGSYPGAVYDPLERKLITGQLYQIRAPEQVFPKLDSYEGVAESPGIPAEYVRKLVPAQTNHHTISCWAYLYNLNTQDLPSIDSGNYLAYFRQRETHRQFIRKGR